MSVGRNFEPLLDSSKPQLCSGFIPRRCRKCPVEPRFQLTALAISGGIVPLNWTIGCVPV
jgi:hypothetical protein